MSQRLNGAGLFSQTVSSLMQGYSQILQFSENKNGITINDIYGSFSKNGATNLLSSYSNSTFASYMSSNFKSFDTDNNGTISSDEMTGYTNQLYAQGLTRNQLAQLGMQYGYSSETLEEVLNNFDSIDKNHDGRVTEAEINAFGIDEEISEKEQEFAKNGLKRMSLFNSVSDTSDNDDNS